MGFYAKMVTINLTKEIKGKKMLAEMPLLS